MLEPPDVRINGARPRGIRVSPPGDGHSHEERQTGQAEERSIAECFPHHPERHRTGEHPEVQPSGEDARDLAPNRRGLSSNGQGIERGEEEAVPAAAQ